MPASTAIKVACFNCGSNSTRVFHSVDNIPVHSCLLMPSRQEAVDYPRGDLRVAFCDDCGFIQNSAFDPAVHEYSQRYEETQAFSAKFVDFAREVCEDYGRKYSLADKTVLEIGCGKGEFLVMLCELTGARGIGIDPGYRPERTTSPAADRLEFIVDFYSEKYTHLAADMVLCRHTLEHIQPTKEFMSMVRRSIGDRQGTIVAFELPDMERILEEQAFWDIYYEHCSYFTLGSLSRLFKSCGFEVLELAKCYDGQYLLIDARPGEHPEGKVLPGEDDLPRLRQLVDEFETKLAEKMTFWRGFFAECRSRGERTVLWGSGSKAVAFLNDLGLSDEVGYVTDINPHRHGMFMPGTGHEIVPTEELKNYRPDVVVAMNPVYVDEIRGSLEQMGLSPRLLAV